MYRHLLVPLDGTDLSTEISSNAVEFARPLGARITFFHAQPDYSAALDGEAEIVRLTSPARFAYAFEGRVRELLAKAEAGARAFGVPCGSATTVNDSPSFAIIEAAREADCDLIYMASHGRRTGIGMMLGSQTLKVLVNAGMPVLVATTLNPLAQSQAITVLLDEHRSLAAVLHALLNVLDSGRDMREASNAELLRGIMDYLHAVSVGQHRPKEEEYLLPKLRVRSSRYEGELAAMAQHNDEDRQLLNQLATTVERLLGGENCLAEVRESAVRGERSLWEHMERVEGVIVPAARSHLLPEDWEAINAAFSDMGDPRFARDTTTELRRLFSRIVNLAPWSSAGA
jgi:nucleotide-binding universal stress UspA family protein/hemerythrin-like domain-containing protein